MGGAVITGVGAAEGVAVTQTLLAAGETTLYASISEGVAAAIAANPATLATGFTLLVVGSGVSVAYIVCKNRNTKEALKAHETRIATLEA